MQRYIIGSIWGRANRNGINSNFEYLFEGDKRIRDLVADFEAQYEGYEDSLQSNFNGFKSQLEDIVDSVGGVNGVTEENIANGAVTANKVAARAVTPDKTTFFDSLNNNNVFDGVYEDGILVYNDSLELGDILYLRNNFDGWEGKTAIVPVKSNTTYSAKVHDEPTNEIFRIGLMDSYPSFYDSSSSQSLVDDFVIEKRTYSKEHTFTTGSSTKYALIYVSNDGTEPRLMVNEGSNFIEYESDTEIRKRYIPSITPSMTSFFESRVESNLFDGNYSDGILQYADSPGYGDILYLRNNYGDWRGKIAIVPVDNNTTYSVKVHDEPTNDIFRIGLMDSYPTFIDSNDINFTADDFITEQRTYNKEHTFTTTNTTQYAMIYVSNDGTEPRLMVEEGSTPSDFISGTFIPSEYLDLSDITQGVQLSKDARFNIPANFNIYHAQDDLVDYYNNPTSLSPTTFHNRFQDLINAHSDVSSYEKYGEDDFGNDLFLYRKKPLEYYKGTYWNQNPGNEGAVLSNPKIIVTGSVHGRERNVNYAMYYAFKEILENTNNSDTIDALLTHVDLIFIPIVSPSGFINNGYENGNGMNINRDFPPYGEVTQGESKALKTVLDNHADMDFFIDYHNMMPRHDLIGYSLTDDEFFKNMTLNMYRSVGRHWQKKDSRLPQAINHRWAYTVASNEGTVGRYVNDVLGVPSALIEIPLESQWISEGRHGSKNTQMGVDILMNTIFACIRHRQ